MTPQQSPAALAAARRLAAEYAALPGASECDPVTAERLLEDPLARAHVTGCLVRARHPDLSCAPSAPGMSYDEIIRDLEAISTAIEEAHL